MVFSKGMNFRCKADDLLPLVFVEKVYNYRYFLHVINLLKENNYKINNINKKINTYDSGVTISKYSHKEPHIALKKSIEDITGKQWNMEQIPVPQQDEGESCGYRMLSNLNKIVKGQEIRSEKDKERKAYIHMISRRSHL